MSVDNGSVNGDYCCMNSSTISVIQNHNLIKYTHIRYEMSTNIYLRENNALPDGIDLDYIAPASALNQYVNMEYNNENNKLLSNNKISTSKNS